MLNEVATADANGGDGEERQLRQPRQHRKRAEHAASHVERPGLIGKLREHLEAEVVAARRARNDDARRGTDEERRELRDQPVANGQPCVGLQRLGGANALLQHPDREATDDVHEDDHYPGDRISFDELTGAVHRAIEVGLRGDRLAPLARCLLVDQPGIEVGVDRHLLAGHGVQGEARRYLRHSARTVRNHHELNDDEDEEDDKANNQVAADNEVSEGVDDATSVAMQQDETRRRDVQRQPEKRGDQEKRREHRELHRVFGVDGNEEDDNARGDVDRQEHVQQRRRKRDDEHPHDADDPDGQQNVGLAEYLGPVRGRGAHGHASPPAAANGARRPANGILVFRA